MSQAPYQVLKKSVSTLMAITTELMAIIMNINDLTHKTINFKKRKVMDDFDRNLIINGILMDF